MANPSANPTSSYKLAGRIDQSTFLQQCESQLTGIPKWNKASEPALLFVLGKLLADPRITDVRYAAYVLATIFIETSHTIWVVAQTRDRRNVPRSHRLKVWRNFVPTGEVLGKRDLRRYRDPVKVFRLPNGNARITEKDGDQWEVNPLGVRKAISDDPSFGSIPNTPVSATYTKDGGDEQVYWGRGYVQLTWWMNYAQAGAELGRGLLLLYQPDLVLDRDVAYEIMIRGLTPEIA